MKKPGQEGISTQIENTKDYRVHGARAVMGSSKDFNIIEKHGARLFTRELGPSWPSCSCVLMCLADCRPAFVQILSLLLRPSANDTVELAVLSQNAGTQLKSVEPFQLLSFAADASDARAWRYVSQRFLALSKKSSKLSFIRSTCASSSSIYVSLEKHSYSKLWILSVHRAQACASSHCEA